MIAVNKNKKKSGEKKKIPIIDTLKPKKRLTKEDKKFIEVFEAAMDVLARQKNAETHCSKQDDNAISDQKFNGIISDEVKVMEKIEESKNDLNNNNRNKSGEEKRIPIIQTLKPKKRLSKKDKELIEITKKVMDVLTKQKNAQV